MAKRLDGKVAFITGASSGIGASMAREFARRGADVVLLARRWERLEAVQGKLASAGQRPPARLRQDVQRAGELEAKLTKLAGEVEEICRHRDEIVRLVEGPALGGQATWPGRARALGAESPQPGAGPAHLARLAASARPSSAVVLRLHASASPRVSASNDRVLLPSV